MKLLITITFLLLFNNCIYCQTIDDIKAKLGVKTKKEKENKEDVRGFKQANGKYYIVQVKDISREEAEKILRHMDRLMEEFLKLYEYPFGTQKCYIIVYGLKKDFDRAANQNGVPGARAFSKREGINHYAITYYAEDLFSVLPHEAFHLFIDNIFKKDPPTWFNEGMGCYYEVAYFSGDSFIVNNVNKYRLGVAKEHINTKRWPKAKDLAGFSYDRFHSDDTVDYSASWCLVYYLRNKNEDAFKKFVNDLVLGKSFLSSIRSNYKMDIKELEEDWIKYIEGLR